MNIYTSNRVSSPREEEAEILVIRYEPQERKEGTSMRFVRPLVKWFGLLSTIVLGALTFAPDTFNVPMHLRPWVFLTFVLWFFAFCAGLFNL